MLSPRLNLTHGQVLWALWYPRWGLPINEPPTGKFKADLLYLRKAGVPFPDEDRLPGSGMTLRYGFDELAELALAVELIDHGVKPGDVAAVLVGWRKKLRAMFRTAYEHREELFEFEDPEVALGKGLYLELTIRYTRTQPTITTPLRLLTPLEAANRLLTQEGSICTRLYVALSALLERVVEAAQEAPEVKRGRRKAASSSARSSGASRP